eukprot:GHRR01016588.1.p1 GENE.GHRR01016588.1~~GHRR01016588.1.p1  ORF type:complete len:419 (+),score=117.45 GHRR01016588.1:349-1605(+)
MHALDAGDCTYSSVHSLNTQHVHPVVSRLTQTGFFRYFKVNIYCDCPLWPDDSMCAMRACSVCECGANEVPAPWLAAEKEAEKTCKAVQNPECDTEGCAIEMEGRVNQSLDPAVKQQLIRHDNGWRGLNNPWMAEGEDAEEFQYINLLVNPERYTGYKGEHAHRIWSAIYNQSCFTDGVSCSEERVFYRLISGMHASISCHLAADYLLDEQQGIWGPNLEEFKQRLGTPEVRDRVQNLYFAYLFVLRAAMKAAPLLTSYEYDTGLQEEDAQTRQLLTQLLANPAIVEACPMPFDEGRLWKGDNAAELKAQLQATFQNITRIMDCVGCEKCKLWGKLQTLGIATALKILFSARDCTGTLPASAALPFGEELELERNEVIALINLLGRFSHSLEMYHRLTAELQRQQGVQPTIAQRSAVI